MGLSWEGRGAHVTTSDAAGAAGATARRSRRSYSARPKPIKVQSASPQAHKRSPYTRPEPSAGSTSNLRLGAEGSAWQEEHEFQPVRGTCVWRSKRWGRVQSSSQGCVNGACMGTGSMRGAKTRIMCVCCHGMLDTDTSHRSYGTSKSEFRSTGAKP